MEGKAVGSVIPNPSVEELTWNRRTVIPQPWLQHYILNVRESSQTNVISSSGDGTWSLAFFYQSLRFIQDQLQSKRNCFLPLSLSHSTAVSTVGSTSLSTQVAGPTLSSTPLLTAQPMLWHPCQQTSKELRAGQRVLAYLPSTSRISRLQCMQLRLRSYLSRLIND